MHEVKRSALVGQSPERLFGLVNDVARYPEFVPGCSGAELISRTDTEIIARLHVRRGPMRASFTTRNALEPFRRMTLELIEGPFTALSGEWLFTPVGEGGCRIDLTLRYQFSNVIKARLFEPFFDETAAALVRAFVGRAKQGEILVPPA